MPPRLVTQNFGALFSEGITPERPAPAAQMQRKRLSALRQAIAHFTRASAFKPQPRNIIAT